jgi:hypothetical protein
VSRSEADGAAILRALIDGASCLSGITSRDWDRLALVAEHNGVLVRLDEKVGAAGLTPSEGFAEAVRRERCRARSVIQVIARVNDVCAVNRMTFLFPKAFQHLPDMGRDVDLLLLAPYGTVHAALAKGLRALPSKMRLQHCVARTTTYDVGEHAIPVDVQYGLLGNLGEERVYPQVLLQNAREVRIDGVDYPTSSPEDQLILQGMQKVYGRHYLRLSDLFCTMNAIGQAGFAWDYVLGSARQLGVFAGLCCYLSYVNQIYREVLGLDLLNPGLRQTLLRQDWGTVRFRDGCYRYPKFSVATRLYVRKFAAALVRGNWESAGRMCLLPVLGMISVLRPLQRRLGRA